MSRVTWRGVTLDKRTAEMMDEVARNTGSIWVQPSQGSWSGAAASAGTHTGCGAVDLMHPSWSVADYDTVVREARRVGFAAWHRTPQQSNWPRHCHLIAVQKGGKGDRGCLSSGAYSQVVDYYEGRNGLASRAKDDGPRKWVGRTWEDYKKEQADKVKPTDPVVVATANVPHRLRPHKADLQRLADQGAEVICTQEQTDNDPKACAPRGWRWYRPKAARSAVVYWNPKRVTAKKKGIWKVSAPGDKFGARYIVWVHFGTKGRGQIRVGAVHITAFKTSGPARAKEFRHQEKRAAEWLAGGKGQRVLAGDFNATLPGRVWTPNLSRVGVWSDKVASGPKGIKIDYVGATKGGRWKPTGTRLGAKGRSDHRPVLVTLRRR